MNQQLIQAQISASFINKADRLFSNNLSDIFIELLQNARRAGASLITVETGEGPDRGTNIIFSDNGHGIDDFSFLLNLGDSDWNEAVERSEDPAGMGFFSLLHSGVKVESNGKEATISKDAFLGKAPVVVTETQSSDVGTGLTFDRPESKISVDSILRQAGLFGSTDVSLNGSLIPRKDFLEEALYVKTIHGVRIGVVAESYGATRNCNFHGKIIDAPITSTHARNVLPPAHPGHSRSLGILLDVVETSSLHLKFPDRSGVVEDEALKLIIREARKAIFEYLASLPQHLAPYALYQEARTLGVDLAEATPHFEPFYVSPHDSSSDNMPFNTEWPFDSLHVGQVHDCAVVELEDDTYELHAFSFDLAFRDLSLPGSLQPIQSMPDYQGYRWYDSLPVCKEFELAIDGKKVEEPSDSPATDILTIVNELELSFVIDRADKSRTFAHRPLKFAGFCDGEDAATLFITRDSEWMVNASPFQGPFDLVEAARHLAFGYSDDADADSYESQRDYFSDEMTSDITRVLGGPMAVAALELERALNWNLRNALDRAGVTEVRISKDADGNWKNEMCWANAA
jgi:hypothetical protein